MWVHPAFASNGFLYLYYTRQKPGGGCGFVNGSPAPPLSPVNRVSRFTMTGNTVALASEVVLIDEMPSPAGNHNAGDLGFGKDGYLYITIGDGGCDYNGGGCGGGNDASRDQHVLTGKILRIAVNPDGTTGIPPGNPFQGAGTARCALTGRTTPGNKCQETFAWGLRNPFRFAFDPNAAGTRVFINDVGQNAREEIDLGQAGADYGWNCREGTMANSTGGLCNPPPPNMVDPVFDYGRTALGSGSRSTRKWRRSSRTSPRTGAATGSRTGASPTGDDAVPKNGCSAGAGFCQTSFPPTASNADTMPLIPSVYSLPLWYRGVALGPGPWALVGSPIL